MAKNATDSRKGMDYWELLYNQKSVCEAFVLENAQGAREAFHQQVARITRLHGAMNAEQCMILLTSLNRGLYDYLQYHLNISLTECCYRNRAHHYSPASLQDVLDAGDSIIMDYHHATRSYQLGQSHFENACAYIQSHLSGDLSLQAVSSAIFISKCHLCEIFSNVTGRTFGDYVKNQRLKYAQLLLRTTQHTIEDISQACGYQTAAYFSTVFKKEMGQSPMQCRRSFLRSEPEEEYHPSLFAGRLPYGLGQYRAEQASPIG